MTKLRMKNTPEDIEIILKQERKQRKKRRKEESRNRNNDDDDSMTPPRIPSTSTYIFDHDLGFDESALPPSQARKVDDYDTSNDNYRNNKNTNNNNNRNFNDKLRDAMEEDLGIGFQEDLLYSREASRTAASFSYGGAASIAMGFSSNSNRNASNGGFEMDEEEYAEMVRAGMWRLKNKDEAERRDAALKAYREKEVREKLETEQRKKVERARIKKLEEKVKKRAVKDDIDARKRYEDLWKKIVKIPVDKAPPEVPLVPTPSATTNLDVEEEEGPQPLPPHPYPLRFTDFPWPLYPPVPFPPLSWPSTSDITATAISNFLLSHVSSSYKKSTLRTAVLAYHPDRFDRLLNRIPEEKREVKERVKELGLRVSQVLNDLLKAGGN